eukprot:scaffold33771_cov14-Prasinocladus_malaysianus.AAC.1
MQSRSHHEKARFISQHWYGYCHHGMHRCRVSHSCQSLLVAWLDHFHISEAKHHMLKDLKTAIVSSAAWASQAKGPTGLNGLLVTMCYPQSKAGSKKRLGCRRNTR